MPNRVVAARTHAAVLSTPHLQHDAAALACITSARAGARHVHQHNSQAARLLLQHAGGHHLHVCPGVLQRYTRLH